jgi:mono/diheme cytochrome c family protein
MSSLRRHLRGLIGLLVFCGTAANAAELPSPEVLQRRMGANPITISVVEPHLSVSDQNVTIDYVGYPAIQVMAAIFGTDWRGKAETIEFRALDGYVSRIDVSRLQPGKAYVVFARRDRSDFSVDNKLQNEANVPLGPYYLVWDNIANPELLAEGARNWPYQISEVELVSLSDDALLPDGLDARYHEGADLAKAHCLSCHTINGYGGKKFEGNLSEIAKGFAEADFIDWVLAPSSVKEGTTMPALSHRLPEVERQRIAKALYDYLSHVPVLR